MAEMKRPANILVMTLVACAMLALVLAAGLALASLRSAHGAGQMAQLQLEQLHRTALADALHALDASGDTLSAGRILLSDEPLGGQKRLLSVAAVEGKLVTVVSESRLAEKGYRRHRVQLLALPLEPRLAFAQSERALFHAVADSGVDNRWLHNHADCDLVVVRDQPAAHQPLALGEGGMALEANGSLFVCDLADEAFETTMHTNLTLSGNAVFAGDLHLASDLSCKEAWIDGTLTVSEGMRLSAETVVLGEDVSETTLAALEATTIYMPHPPEVADGQEAEIVILPLAELVREPASKTAYLMLQQLE